MQDKEFDNLFRSKLNDMEVEPSRHVWAGITAGLDNKGSNRSLVSWLSIAASVIVLVAAGIVFIPKKGTDTNKPVKGGVAKVSKPVTIPAVSKTNSVATQPQTVVQPAPVVNQVAKVKNADISKPTVVKQTSPEVVVPAPIVAPEEQPVIAAVQEKQNVITPVVPGDDIALSVKPVMGDVSAPVAKQIAATNVQPAADNSDGAAVKPKHRAHGIAGLLNAVIARVDKRKDKIIEFRDADDDESNIASVNLGILKFKKEGK